MSPFVARYNILCAETAPTRSQTKDAEAAKHGFEAAQYSIVDTYPFAGFRVVQFDLPVLSHYSYMVISHDECVVVDPGRDVDVYVDHAAKEGATIKGVFLTHSHADFVAGHMELAKREKMPIYISAKSAAKFKHIPTSDETTIEVGQAVLTILETPGHTPDGTVALISSKQNIDSPLVLLSGDTLFVGGVGRPDLLGEGMAASTLASMLFDTWYGKLAKLPDSVVVMPAHGAGSLCGAHLSDAPTSTIGAERNTNPYFVYKDRGEFIANVLEGLSEAPQYFKHNAAMNHDGPELVEWEPKELPWVDPSDSLTDISEYYVADIRDATAYSIGHVPNSVNIGIRGRFETWVGIMVPWNANLVVCGENEDQLKEAVHRLHRVGYQPQCLLYEQWSAANQTIAKNPMADPQALYAQMQTTESPIIVDVRLPTEWMGLRIGSTLNIPLNELATKSGKLHHSQKIVTVCNSAYRSSMAVGVLERQGFTQVSNMNGGGEAWINAGLPVFQTHKAGVASAAPKREIRLAERISSADLKRMQMDLPGTFDLIDIRPAEHFADYNIPGSVNAELADVMNNPAYLTGVGPLVIVDRDGSLGMMVAGALSQKSDRNIKALHGGMQSYWSESDYGAYAQPITAPSGVPMHLPPQRPPIAAPHGTDVSPPVSKPPPVSAKKSAGC
ncbi:MBL fold metallo-hydrolase [Novipirellula herctigrandis]|uniref:MBL fold metallo-hydrolase n=1 Tax=Novipirellula herctigrandis TaxID=2527986 RepID=UPI003AF3CD8D